MGFNYDTIIAEAQKEGRKQMKELARKLAKEHPEVVRRGVGALIDGIPTSRERTRQRQDLQSLTDPEVLKRAIEDMVQATSEQETMELLFGGRLNKTGG